MRILNRHDIEKLIDMPEALELAEKAFLAVSKGEGDMPERLALSVGKSPNSILIMPSYHAELGVAGMKVISIFPTNRRIGRPTIAAQMLLVSADSGEVIASMDGTIITALRTGAASGIATKYLSNPKAESLGVFGAGAQARTQIKAILAVREIGNVVILDKDPAKAERLADELSDASAVDSKDPTRTCTFKATEDPERVIRESEILVTATTSETPVFDGKLLNEGTHINAIGSFKPHVRELNDTSVQRALIFVDSREHALKEAGDLATPIRNGVISERNIRGELGELILGRITGRTAPSDITLFKSVGLALQDLFVAQQVFQKAQELDVGVLT
jgi:ornithine cyclodeaminase/alanine dehydrogenase-like protein (mu-crystallin family)